MTQFSGVIVTAAAGMGAYLYVSWPGIKRKLRRNRVELVSHRMPYKGDKRCR